MINFKNVTKKFNQQVIIENTNYKSPTKGIVGIIGPSGIGKSTLVNIISSFDTDYTGEVSVNNDNIKNIDTDHYRKNNIGFIFQNFNLLSGYTSIENILLACETNEENINYAHKLLQKLNIEDKINENVDNLSGGEKQRVAIARALIKQPTIIIADEPTGSLDRANTQEIMNIIKDISQDTLVFLITHDEDNEQYADQLITIEDEQIVILKEITSNQNIPITKQNDNHNLSNFDTGKILNLTKKNITVNIKSYLTIAFALCIGLVALLFSFSFKNVINAEISDFKEKNSAFNNGYITYVQDEDQYNTLKADERIENVYYQYVYDDVTLNHQDQGINIEHKYPTAKANQSMSYGVMPRRDKNEIALSPSLAKKYSNNINELIDQSLDITVNNETITLTISGIFNAAYDYFIISSNIEQEINEHITTEPYSISYDVRNFEDIVSVSNDLKEANYKQIDAAFEVEAFLNTFKSIQNIFIIISLITLAISIFITIILLQKLNETKTKFIGLLKANGYNRQNINLLVIGENTALAVITTILTIVLIIMTLIITNLLNINFIVNSQEVIITILATFILVIILSTTMTIKTIKTDPAQLLKGH